MVDTGDSVNGISKTSTKSEEEKKVNTTGDTFNGSDINKTSTRSEEEEKLVNTMALQAANVELSSPIRDWLSKRWAEIRPWSKFFKKSHFDIPTPAKLGKRFCKNVEHFQSNYVFVFPVLFMYCLIAYPLLIVVLIASGVICYQLSAKQRERKLMIANHEVTITLQYAIVLLLSIPILLLTGAGPSVFWVLGASLFCIILHATFYNFEIHGGDDVEALLTGQITEDA